MASELSQRRKSHATPLATWRRRHLLAGAWLLALGLALGGCSTFRLYQKCGFSGCPGDPQISAAIDDSLRKQADISAWDIHVQTLDRVVYLYGLVDTEPQRSLAAAIAMETPGVTRVVNSISVRNFVR